MIQKRVVVLPAFWQRQKSVSSAGDTTTESTSRNSARLGVNRFLGSRWAVNGSGQAEQNQELDTGEERTTTGEVLLVAGFDAFDAFDVGDVNIYTSLTTYTNPTDGGRFRIDFDGRSVFVCDRVELELEESTGYRVVRLVGGRMTLRWWLIGCCFLLEACASAPRETAVMRSSGAVGMTASEIRFRLHDFAMRYPGMIEETVLRISRDSIDVTVQQNLLRWQLHGIPAYFRTLFHSDPYLSLADTWLLTLQAIEYYEDGTGKGDFGEHQVRVLATYREFETELRGLVWAARADSVTPEEEARVMAWVGENPIESHLFVRRSVLPSVARTMAEGGGSIGSAVASVESGIQDINTRVTILTDFIPKQVQWQVERASHELLGGLDPDSGLEKLLHVSDHIGEVDSLITRSLASAFDAIDGQRTAALEAVAQERATIIAAIVSEREALLTAVTAERLTALESIQQLVAASLSNVRETSDSTVDQVFRRALFLVALIFVAAIIYRFVSVRVIGTGKVKT